MTCSPVLFLIFNRPDTTARVFEAIRQARPSRLYVAADGPRENRSGEADRCAEARHIATAVDWPCQVTTLFRDRNLGCRKAVSAAIDWFFENEEEGIILEDDCLPAPDFFPFCVELLVRYHDDKRIMCITGNNHQETMGDYPYSYYFSKYAHIWGWASWRRAWQLNDVELINLNEYVRSNSLTGMSTTPGFAEYWERNFRSVESGRVDTWDYGWLLSCWEQNGLTATPRVNLVSNIGFGPAATHTHNINSPAACMATRELSFPLSHPLIVAVHNRFDAHVDTQHFSIGPTKSENSLISLARRIKHKLRGWRR